VNLDLMELYYGYTNLGEGIRSLSELVKEQLGEYDYQIDESYAVLTDPIEPPLNGGGGGGGETGCFDGDPFWDCIWCEVAVIATSFRSSYQQKLQF